MAVKIASAIHASEWRVIDSVPLHRSPCFWLRRVAKAGGVHCSVASQRLCPAGTATDRKSFIEAFETSCQAVALSAAGGHSFVAPAAL